MFSGPDALRRRLFREILSAYFADDKPLLSYYRQLFAIFTRPFTLSLIAAKKYALLASLHLASASAATLSCRNFFFT